MNTFTQKSSSSSSPIYWGVVISGCILLLLSFGMRSGFGLFVKPISETYGWGREIISTAIAIQNLTWGVSAVLVGMLSDRFGNLKVMLSGIVCYTLGMLLIPFSDSPLLLNTTLGLFMGAGIGGTAFGIVLPSLTRAVPKERREWVLGLGTAAGSLGQFLLVPLIGEFIKEFTWTTSLYLMGAMCFTMIIFVFPLASFSGKSEDRKTNNHTKMSITLGSALTYPSYILLVLGFFVCGFQLGFITVHLPPYITDITNDPGLAAWSFALVGLGNVFGAYYAGKLATKHSKNVLLSLIYFGRALLIALFILLPVSIFTVYTFSITLGLLWLATIPPTSGLVATMFGTRYMATLYGIVFLNHQIGSFIGVWLGGVLFDFTQSYNWVWIINIALGVASGLVHLPIKNVVYPNLAKLQTLSQSTT